MQEMTQLQSPEWEDPLEEGMATHSSLLAWRIPWTEVDYSPRGRKESDSTEQLSVHVPNIARLWTGCQGNRLTE